MKFTVYREIFFSSAHRLRNYNGKCENLHGHNWRVRLYVSTEELDETGFVVDFKVLDKILKDVTDILDHQNINELPFFTETNPTAENIAKFIFDESQKMINDSRVKLSKVSVWESEKSCATVEV